MLQKNFKFREDEEINEEFCQIWHFPRYLGRGSIILNRVDRANADLLHFCEGVATEFGGHVFGVAHAGLFL